ncbi:MAG: YqgE/AlgH family protein [Gammaproteobacteria bacterium]|jgi:putative transcriptional regulator
MGDLTSLSNQFLIAMPSLADPNFVRSVSFICEHSEQGALGLVINHPLDMQLGDLCEQLDLPCEDDAVRGLPVYSGGPVQPERGFVLHQPTGNWESTLQITENLALTTSADILQALAAGEGPSHTLIALGYAGWAAGQLEHELASNAWLTCPADPHILFDLPPQHRWQAAATKLGVDLSLLSGDAGHA